MRFDAQKAKSGQPRFTRFFVSLPVSAVSDAALASVRQLLEARGEIFRPGLYEVAVHSEPRWLELRCGWAESDMPQPGQTGTLWSFLEGLSSLFEGQPAVGLAVDHQTEKLHFELVEGGRRVRTFIYSREAGGWARSTGRAQPWERAVFFSDEDQRAAAEKATTDADRAEVNRVFAFDEIKLDVALPFPGTRVASERILHALGLPEASSSPTFSVTQLPVPVRVRMARVPPGDAPEEIRRAWIGLMLPVSRRWPKVEEAPPSLASRVRGFFGRGTPTGHDIDTEVAIGLLGHHAPAAAQWWASRKLGPVLRFDQRSCEVVSAAEPAKPEDDAVRWVSDAQWLYSQGRYEDAACFVLSALSILEQAGPGYLPELLRATNNLGTVYRRLGRYEDAVQVLEQSASAHEQEGRQEGLRFVLNNLATAYSFAGHPEKAQQTWARCLTLSPGQPDEEAARVLDNLASSALRTSREIGPEVVEHARRAHAVWVEVLGEDAVDTAVSGVILGAIEARRGNYDQARQWVVPAIATLDKHLGAGHPELCGALNLLGRVEAVEGRLSEARRVFARSLEIGQQALGSADPEVLEAREGLRVVESLSHELELS